MSGWFDYMVLCHRINVGDACAGVDCIICWDHTYRADAAFVKLQEVLAKQLLPPLTEAINKIAAWYDDMMQPRYTQQAINAWQSAPFYRVDTGNGPRNRQHRRKESNRD
jgi:hypothetical protein